MLVALWTSLLALEPVVRVVSSLVDCPDAEAVRAQLVTLLPAGSASGSDADVASLEQSRDRLSVMLRRPDGTLLGRRELVRNASCSELAAAAALVIATWESDVHPEFAVALPPVADSPAERTASADAVAPVTTASVAIPSEAATPVTTASVATAPVSAATRAATAASPATTPAMAGPSPPAAAFDLGLALAVLAGPNALGGSWDKDVAGAATLTADWIVRGQGAGLRVALSLSSERTQPLADGEAHWRRGTAGLGGVYRARLSPRSAAVDVHAEGLVAALDFRGTGFEVNHHDRDLDLGGGVGVRLWPALAGRWRPWVELGAQLWPQEHVVTTRSAGERTSLPAVEGCLSLGISFATDEPL